MFRASGSRLIAYVGKVKITDLPREWQAPVDTVCKTQEDKDTRVKNAEIRGSKPHRSHDDPSDPLDVISVRLLNEKNQRISSIHIHEDGTSKLVTWR